MPRRTMLAAPIALALLAAPIAFALLAACERPPASAWPPEVVDNFMRGCRDRTADAQCRCALERLQQRFTLEEFSRMERELAGGTVPKPLADAVSGCAEG